jgi:hypothetical protein
MLKQPWRSVCVSAGRRTHSRPGRVDSANRLKRGRGASNSPHWPIRQSSVRERNLFDSASVLRTAALPLAVPIDASAASVELEGFTQGSNCALPAHIPGTLSRPRISKQSWPARRQKFHGDDHVGSRPKSCLTARYVGAESSCFQSQGSISSMLGDSATISRRRDHGFRIRATADWLTYKQVATAVRITS